MSCWGGREGQRSVDVGIFLRAYKAQASCFNFVLCPCLSGVSWLPLGREAENSLVPCAMPPSNPADCPQPAVWFLSWVCVVLPPYSMRALHWAVGEQPSVQERAPIHMLTARCAAKSCLGALLLSPNPCLCKGPAAWASQGFSSSLEAPGPVKGSCRPLWRLCRLFYVPWLELLPTCLPCFPPRTVVELDATLWRGGGTQYFTAVFCLIPVQTGWC